MTKYRDGTAIPTGYSTSDWSGLSTGGYAVYNDDENNVDTYGYLYNWYATTDSRNIAPEGWHVPTDAEWTTLVDYLGGNPASSPGGKMQETGTTHWRSPNTAATNETGFTALPGGGRSGGNYSSINYFCHFWSSTVGNGTQAWYRNLSYNNSGAYRHLQLKQHGFSVRCVRD